MFMWVILGAALIGMLLDFLLNSTNIFDSSTNNNESSDKDVSSNKKEETEDEL